jgi:hypothetical protein
MSLHIYTGGAGCGKTYSVFERLEQELEANPLKEHQRVLAITFMHGARARLQEKLGSLQSLKRRFDASTLDSLAWTICRRWISKVIELGLTMPVISDYDQIAHIASILILDENIHLWITTTYPIIIVDEAQDLDVVRLKLIEELMKSGCVLLAFDEFQCLDQTNRPVAVVDWIDGKSIPTILNENQRTANTHLLNAAHQVRNGESLTVDHVTFRLKLAAHRKGLPPTLAATLIAYQFLNDGNFAILTPSKNSKFVLEIVELLQTQTLGARNLGPFTKLSWEDASAKSFEEVRDTISKATDFSIIALSELLLPHIDLLVVQHTLKTLKRIKATTGVEVFDRDRILEVYDRHLSALKQHVRPRTASRTAMTIHQAKNREFDNVVIIWPFLIPPDADARRRLLYNAITRARKTCLILVQSKALIEQSPFV